MKRACDVNPEEAAKWLIVGFSKCWDWYQVAEALGVDPRQGSEAEDLHAACQFLPSAPWLYGVKRSRPVRATIAAEFPRLHAYLDTNHGKPEKLLAAIPQVLKLKCRGQHIALKSAEDRKEQRATQEDMRRVQAANKAARRQQLSHQRGAWKTCK